MNIKRIADFKKRDQSIHEKYLKKIKTMFEQNYQSKVRIELLDKRSSSPCLKKMTSTLLNVVSNVTPWGDVTNITFL